MTKEHRSSDADHSTRVDPEVGKELERLRGASDDQLRILDREREAKRIMWYQTQDWNPQEGDPLDRAYRVLLRKLRIQEDQAPVVRRDERAITFHSMNFCPTLEACKILGLDTRRVCRLSSERSTDALVRQVDGRLSFSRNYRKIRPHSQYCEESISYRNQLHVLPASNGAEAGAVHSLNLSASRTLL